ncbi:MAG: transposase [Leptolyngbyaceae cyanobacterium RM1_405_57]|nr:transposase [Leptolyngbyaceae cyanobacterium RM1_405_57]
MATRYYISSLTSNAKQLSKAVRSHWLVENSPCYFHA